MSEKMIFCLGEGKYETKGAGYQKNLQIFNQSVSQEIYQKTYNSLRAKEFKLPIAKWIDIKDVPKEKQTTTMVQLGGYLKVLSYKDAWLEMWSALTQSDKTFFMELPNFNAAIFKDITGIDVNLPTETIEIEGKKYTIDEIKKALGK